MDTFALSIALDAALADETPSDRVETDQAAAAPLVPAAPVALAPAAVVVDPASRTGCAWFAVPAPARAGAAPRV